MDVGAVERQVFNADGVFTSEFKGLLNGSGAAAGTVSRATLEGLSNVASMEALDAAVSSPAFGLPAAFVTNYGRVHAMGAADVLAADWVAAGDAIVLGAAKAFAKVAMAARVVDATAATGGITVQKKNETIVHLLSLPESDAAVLGRYDAEQLAKMARDNNSYQMDAVNKDEDLRRRVRDAEEIRTNLLSMSTSDAALRRQQLYARVVFWVFVAIMIALLLALTAEFMTGSWRALYITCTLTTVAVIALQTSGVVYRTVTQWTG